MPIIVATANVQNLPNLPRKDVRKCARTVAGMGVTVCGFQEIAQTQDREDLRTGLGPAYELLTHGTPLVELAIGYDTRGLTYVDGSLHAHLLDHGEPHLEPNRYYLEARFTRNNRPRLAPIAVGTTHTVSKAWSPGNVTERSHRQDLWNHQWDQIGRHQRHTLKDGVTVLGTGDVNRTHALPPITPGMRVVGRNGLDWVWVLEGPEVGFTFLAVHTKGDPSDHDVLAVEGGLANLA